MTDPSRSDLQQELVRLRRAVSRTETETAAEIDRRDREHQRELDAMGRALESRDLIGQAKGVIIATLKCTAERAFDLLRQQSQHENRKLVDVAADIARRATVKAPGRRQSPPEPTR